MPTAETANTPTEQPQTAAPATAAPVRGVRFPGPGDGVLLDTLAALGGNMEYYQRLAVNDLYAKTETALEYAMGFLGPLIHDCPASLQAAVDLATELRDATHEKLIGAVQLSDFPHWLKNAQRIAGLGDYALRWSAINARFHAALDRHEGGAAEVFMVRRLSDGKQEFRRLGIRDPLPMTPQ